MKTFQREGCPQADFSHAYRPADYQYETFASNYISMLVRWHNCICCLQFEPRKEMPVNSSFEIFEWNLLICCSPLGQHTVSSVTEVIFLFRALLVTTVHSRKQISLTSQHEPHTRRLTHTQRYSCTWIKSITANSKIPFPFNLETAHLFYDLRRFCVIKTKKMLNKK